MNIKYPVIIGNKQLYNITSSAPISLEKIEKRWKLFGHILRSPSTTPAQTASKYYFQHNIKNHGQKTTLPKILHDDLDLIKLTLLNTNDYTSLKEKAANRNDWQKFTKQIVDQHKKNEDTKRKHKETSQKTSSSNRNNQNQPKEHSNNIPTPPGLDFRKRHKAEITTKNGPTYIIYVRSPITEANDLNNELMDTN
jgi:hypothetical protein